MARYRRKPVVIEAEQFLLDKKPWPEGVERAKTYGNVGDRWRPGNLIVRANGRAHRVISGDWIIRASNGDVNICEPDIFEATYEKVEDMTFTHPGSKEPK